MSAWLAVVLAAAPAWKVTFSTSQGTDHGNGKIVATSDVAWVITPAEVTMTAEGTEHDQPVKAKVSKPKPTPEKVREAIAALLPSLPKASGSYSISPYVDDEGWSSEAIEVVVNGKAVRFNLVQGKGSPPLTPELVKLKELVGQAIRG